MQSFPHKMKPVSSFISKRLIIVVQSIVHKFAHILDNDKLMLALEHIQFLDLKAVIASLITNVIFVVR